MSHDLVEGWYKDPFGRHEARWLSDGVPTKLVRDGEVESFDDPPEEEPSQPIEEIQATPSDGGDLYRTDGTSLDERMREAGEFGATGGAFIPMPNERDR